MRPPLAVILLLLAVPLMGSDCHVAARVGGSPQPPPDDVTDPPPASGGGGGVIIVTSNASRTLTPPADAARIERRDLEAALAAGVWTPPEVLRMARASEGHDPTPVVPAAWEDASVTPGGTTKPSPPAVVPEPTGFVLFAGGLWLASRISRARDASGA